MAEPLPPDPDELSCLDRWQQGRLRRVRIVTAVGVGMGLAATLWFLADPTTRAMVLGQGELVTVEVLGSQQVDACDRLLGSDGPASRLAVEFTGGREEVGAARVGAVTTCADYAVGDVLEVRALPDGSLTNRSASAPRIVVGMIAVLISLAILRLRAAGTRYQRAAERLATPDWRPVRAGSVELGRRISTPGTDVVRWPSGGSRPVDPDTASVLVLLGAEPGDPALVQTEDGARHWRTLVRPPDQGPSRTSSP